MKKNVVYLFYVIGVSFAIRYFYKFFPDLIRSFTAEEGGVFNILLKFLGLIINFSFVFILFMYAKKLTSNQDTETTLIKPVGVVKRCTGYLLYLIGILFMISIIGNAYLYFRFGSPKTLMGKVNTLIFMIMFLVFVIESFKFGRKWTKKEKIKMIIRI